jgi:hypothetical protein
MELLLQVPKSSSEVVVLVADGYRVSIEPAQR